MNPWPSEPAVADSTSAGRAHQELLRFNGPVYEPEHDRERLSRQHARIRDLMRDGVWRTLGEIAAATSDPVASISAQLRHLRKPRFGSWVVEKRPRGERWTGLWEYQLRAAP